jgi:hypothetical protein
MLLNELFNNNALGEGNSIPAPRAPCIPKAPVLKKIKPVKIKKNTP